MSSTDLVKLPDAVVRRGIEEYQWRTLANLFPGAKLESALLVWDYCKARGLDPMKKPCHIVPMRVKNAKGEWEWRDVVMPGIYEYRITAHRTGLYRGHTEPVFGPEREFAGVNAPEWCAMTIYRAAPDGTTSSFPVKVWFNEVVATKHDGTANERWSKAPRQMHLKCTEAAGLREGFPEEFGGEATAEELEGKSLGDEDEAPQVSAPPFQRKSDVLDVAPQQHTPPPQPIVEAGPPAPDAVEPEPEPTNVGVIATLTDGVGGAIFAELNTGFKAGTRDPELVKSLRDLHQHHRRLELITKPSSNAQRFTPKIVEILVLPEATA